MIKPHPRRPGWFQVGMDIGEPLFGVPGVYFEGGCLLAHLTHLPLLDHPDVVRYRLTGASDGDTWARRDAWCGNLGFKLRTTQHQVMDFARKRRGFLLADEPRLGKTVASLMCHQQWRADHGEKNYGPLVIVAPLSTRAVWMGWARRIFPEEKMGIISGKTFKPEMLQHPIIFGHYDVISKWQALFDIGTVVFDEAHLLTNHKSDRSLASMLLASKARHAIPMTGTPIYTFPPDLWNILNLAIAGPWGSWYDFANRYGAPVPSGYGTTYSGVSNEAELKLRMEDVMLRRLWKDCCDDLPPITRSVVVADLTAGERAKLDVLAGKLKAERTNTAGNLAAYRKLVTTIKLDDVVHEAGKVLDRQQPVVIWTWHKECADRVVKRLVDRGRPAFLIHGEVPVGQRDDRMQQWKEGPPAALVANMAVAGAGIDLSHARIAIFAEIDYTPAMLGQAEMRTYAPDRPTDIVFVVANHIVDQRIVRSLVEKLSAATPLGVGAAVDAIDALRDAVMGPEDDGDLDRLLQDILAGV